MSATNLFEAEILSLIFTATAIANVADNAAASPLTNLYISLHTSDPSDAGDQSTGETSYTGYARVAVARTTGGWTVTAGSCSNDADVTFGQCSAGTPLLTHIGLGSAASGAGRLFLSNALTSSLQMSVGATPIFSATQLVFTCD